ATPNINNYYSKDAGEWLEGLHIKKSINSDGVMEYSLENGKYLGFTKNSRVGLWAILKMSDPNFKGISTDFLCYLSHERHLKLCGDHIHGLQQI
ncbi:hypothetical protein, partial [Mycoplasmopsis bovis]|uniref:hypothetical protein n=1 Tax=Mycoplasmopsis bovis TaxID=28903 RepID=UPI003D2D6D76